MCLSFEIMAAMHTRWLVFVPWVRKMLAIVLQKSSDQIDAYFRTFWWSGHKLQAIHSITLLRDKPTLMENLFPARKCTRAVQRANRVMGRGCGLEAQRYAPSRARYEIIIWLANGGLRGSSIYTASRSPPTLFSAPLSFPFLRRECVQGGTRG